MERITEDYCSSEVSKILKEKGLDKEHFRHYVQVQNGDGTIEAVGVCTHQIAMKWLREVHDIDISIMPVLANEYNHHKYYIWAAPHTRDKADTYEAAVEAALKYSLENLI